MRRREKKRGGKKEKTGKKENTDENSGPYIIASSRPPERRPLERHTLVTIGQNRIHNSCYIIAVVCVLVVVVYSLARMWLALHSRPVFRDGFLPAYTMWC